MCSKCCEGSVFGLGKTGFTLLFQIVVLLAIFLASQGWRFLCPPRPGLSTVELEKKQ